jgi:RNA recognition motif-containing protein
VWVSGLSPTTRATDIKQVFIKYGKVVAAKVVTNQKIPGQKCYGYVTMATVEDVEKCVEKLHRSELHGKIITVERVSRVPNFQYCTKL